MLYLLDRDRAFSNVKYARHLHRNVLAVVCYQCPLSLTWFNSNPSIDYITSIKHVGMDKQFHPALYWACDYLSMLGSKLSCVSKGGPSRLTHVLSGYFIVPVIIRLPHCQQNSLLEYGYVYFHDMINTHQNIIKSFICILWTDSIVWLLVASFFLFGFRLIEGG